MVEVGAIDVLLVLVDGDVAPEAAPEAASLDGEHILHCAVDTGHKHLAALLLEFAGDDLGILLVDGIALETRDVQARQDLVFRVARYVGVLHRFQCRGDEGQQEGHDDNHYGCIDERINVSICVNLHILALLYFLVARFARMEMLRSTTQ